ncbi:MAG TPA: hypothetical protein VFY93_04515 [Planctomycetota bacterium]|nr:hypothetical protein [Planctomycetota bacterium]
MRSPRILAAAVAALAAVAAADDALLQQWDAPKRETFALKKMPGGEAALELRKRYGYNFEFPATDDQVALKAKNATYLEALDLLADGLNLYLVGMAVPEGKRKFGEGGLALVKADEPMGPALAAYLGPSRLSIETVSVLAVRRCAPRGKLSVPGLPDVEGLRERIEKDMERFGTGASNRPRLRLELKWITEPGFDDVALTAISIIQAIDDKGQSLRPLHDPRLPVSANSTIELDFERPAGKVKAIRKLQGSARFAIPVDRGEVSFRVEDRGTPKTLGRAAVTVDGIESPKVTFTIVGTPSGVLREGFVSIDVGTKSDGWFPGVPADLVVVAYDAKGAEVDGHVRDASAGEGRSTYVLELKETPAKLVFRAVTQVAARELPFLFGSIPLPE